MLNALSTIHGRLLELEGCSVPDPYRIPQLWLEHPPAKSGRVVSVDPVQYFRGAVENILAAEDLSPTMLSSLGEWTKEAVTYNMFPRLTAAWDHDGDGRIGLDDLSGGFRETGTFLKCLAILPYLKKMGFNTVHMLPVTMIGIDGNKGTLGSPYAIRNPYKLDPRLAEPWLGLDVDAEFSAFVEAAHRLGMRVVMEFVFRTAAKDSEWIPDHPNWFYWIDADVPDRDASGGHAGGYGNPHFSKDELNTIHARVRKNDTASLPPPSMAYRKLFTDPPETVEYIDNRYIGTTWDDKRVRIPGAFADWPPDDVQPPWNDVTYLKMYDHDSFNYIAYNTIRIYDARLASVDNENRGLWNTVINIIPHYQKNFAIDGVMIDMGHALPRRLKQSIVERARKVNPDFAFWEENFAISARSRHEGYNASVGYLWSDEHLPHKLREFCAMLSSVDTPVPFFATPETHNTPRAAKRPGGIAFSRMALVVNGFLPAMLFVHQGYELGETFPVNTGLGFDRAEIARLPSHTLPLFSESALSWDNPDEFSTLVTRVIELRNQWSLVVTDPRHETFRLVPSTNEEVLAYARTSTDGTHVLVVVANTNCEHAAKTTVTLPTTDAKVTDALGKRSFKGKDGAFEIKLDPGQAVVFPLTEPLV